MYWLDWILIWVPLIIVVFAAFKSQKYVKGVADFLSAGRIAGRYVVSVASGEAAMGLISVVAVMEMYYRSGFAISFWSTLTAPISMILGLVGFCTYRFRETKAMTMGQFFEIRYSRSLRIVAAVIQSISGIINYAIFPAVGGRFLVYFLGLPLTFRFLGTTWSTYGVVMFCFLAVALIIACLGGQVTIMVTDCVQGLLSYPMFVVVVAYFFYRFSWTGEMAPSLMCRAPGESFLNPYDTENLRDFNLFYVLCGIVTVFLNRMSWGGSSGYNGAAKSAHEAKMGALLGSWRGGFGTMMYILIAVVAFTFLNHGHFKDEAREVRQELAAKAIDDVLRIDHPESGKLSAAEALHNAFKQDVKASFATIPPRDHFPDPPKKIRRQDFGTEQEYDAAKEKLDAEVKVFHDACADPYPKTVLDLIDKNVEKAVLPETMSEAEQQKFRDDQRAFLKKKGQTFGTIYNQMLVSVAIRKMLPMGVTGIFCALMIFLMVSTDTTYMHSWGSILIQDFVLPLRKKPFTPEQQINVLRISITGVCIFAFLFSYYFAQIDFILMFFAITGAIWAGAGSVITFGLYWKKGTTQAAFASLIAGATIAIAGIIGQQTWASHIYPYFEKAGMVEEVNQMLLAITKPFHPYVVWGNPEGPLNAHKFPINSTEIGFICNVICILLYVSVSLLTCKEPFNMERMLHRGKYSLDPEAAKAAAEAKKKENEGISTPKRVWNFFQHNMVGIDHQYTKGDKVLAYSVFAYSFGYGFLLNFIIVIIWNFFHKWDIKWWSWFFFYKQFLVSGIIGIISTFWFGICGTRDLMRLFKDLAAKEANALDDGRVEGNVSVADIAAVKAAEGAKAEAPAASVTKEPEKK